MPSPIFIRAVSYRFQDKCVSAEQCPPLHIAYYLYIAHQAFQTRRTVSGVLSSAISVRRVRDRMLGISACMRVEANYTGGRLTVPRCYLSALGHCQFARRRDLTRIQRTAGSRWGCVSTGRGSWERRGAHVSMWVSEVSAFRVVSVRVVWVPEVTGGARLSMGRSPVVSHRLSEWVAGR